MGKAILGHGGTLAALILALTGCGTGAPRGLGTPASATDIQLASSVSQKAPSRKTHGTQPPTSKVRPQPAEYAKFPGYVVLVSDLGRSELGLQRAIGELGGSVGSASRRESDVLETTATVAEGYSEDDLLSKLDQVGLVVKSGDFHRLEIRTYSPYYDPAAPSTRDAMRHSFQIRIQLRESNSDKIATRAHRPFNHYELRLAPPERDPKTLWPAK